MHIITTKKSFLSAIGSAADVTPAKATLPVLANVLIDVTDDSCSVLATDLYVSVSRKFDATKVKETGRVCVSARDLKSRVTAMPDGDMVVKSDDSKLTITSGKRRFTLPAVDPSDFPELPKVSELQDVDADALRTVLRQCLPAVSEDESRAHLSSLYLHGDTLTGAGTDGHRLIVSRTEGSGIGSGLIPRKGVKLIARTIEGAAVVRAAFNSGLFMLEADGVEYTVKLVDSQFPPYEQVIPKPTGITFAVDRLAMIDAVRAVASAASERTGGIKLAFGKSAIVIESESPEAGQSHDEVPCDGTGEVTIGINGRYLVELLSVLDGENVTIETGGELEPVKLTGDGETVAIAMPMRV